MPGRFVDQATIQIESGAGGHGCVNFRRERFIPKGGPDGGDGGRGGSVVIAADPHKRTLLDFRYQKVFKAIKGGAGAGANQNGKDADDRVIPVPPGTVVTDSETGETVADLVEPGAQVVVAAGGRGGRGNSCFATSTDRTPTRAEPGGKAVQRTIELELKLLADAGLVGLPNAGKSTFLASVTAARPKIAGYPFTTLAPNLGLVRIGTEESFLLADIPGLIEGASEGKGLGLDFLRHIERCRLLIYLVDATSHDPSRDLEVLRKELGNYREDLLTRPSLVVWNKMDAVADPDSIPGAGRVEWKISAATGEGVRPLLFEVYRLIQEGEDGKGEG